MVQKTLLKNGLRVLTDAMPGMASVAFGVWADAGAADESPHEYGQAHVLEHMLFKGTHRYSALALAEGIEDVGGQVNAFTERETTHLYSRVLAEHLPVAVELLGDMVCHSVFPEMELQHERQVLVEEIRKYESLPEERIHDLLMESLWQGGALGHSILGPEEHVRTVTREALQKCWQRHFTADRVLVTAAGYLDHETVVGLVETAFADLPLEKSAWPAFPPGERVRSLLLDEDEEQVHFCWGGRTFPAADDRNFPLMMLDAVLGATTTSRLFQEIREQRGLAYDIASYTMGFRETGLFCATASCSPDSCMEVIALVRQQIDALRANGISEKELARAKEQMKVSLALSSESTIDRMRMLAHHTYTWGTVYPVDHLIETINAVTLDDVNQLGRDMLNTEHWSFTAIGPIDRGNVEEMIGTA